jgi:hypothetical protein
VTTSTTSLLRRLQATVSAAVLAVLLPALLAVPVAPSALAAEAPLDPLPPVLDATDGFCERAPTHNPFPDVSDADPAIRQIICQAADEVGIAFGFADGTYGPNQGITRRQMALFLVRMIDLANALERAALVDLPPYGGVNRFVDAQGEGEEVVAAINRLAEAEIAQGTSPVTYEPAAPVTRRQMALFVARTWEFLTGAALPAGGRYFSDTDEESPEAADAIARTAGAGIFAGNPDRTFGPGEGLTRRQMAFVNTRVLQLAFQQGLVFTPFPFGTLVLDPEVSGSAVNTARTVTATFTDPDGNPVQGAEITFGIFRFDEATQGYLNDPNPTIEQTATTNAAGVATLTYTGPLNAAADEMVAFVSDPDLGAATPFGLSIHVWTTPAASGHFQGAVFGLAGDVIHTGVISRPAGEDPPILFRAFVLAEAPAGIYRVDGAPVSREAFVEALEAELAAFGLAAVDIQYNASPPGGVFDLVTTG